MTRRRAGPRSPWSWPFAGPSRRIQFAVCARSCAAGQAAVSFESKDDQKSESASVSHAARGEGGGQFRW